MVASKRPNPRQKKKRSIKGITKVSIPNDNGAPVTRMIIISAGRVNSKFTQLEMTLDSGKRYFGI